MTQIINIKNQKIMIYRDSRFIYNNLIFNKCIYSEPAQYFLIVI